MRRFAGLFTKTRASSNLPDDPENAEADVAQETTPASISDDQVEDNMTSRNSEGFMRRFAGLITKTRASSNLPDDTENAVAQEATPASNSDDQDEDNMTSRNSFMRRFAGLITKTRASSNLPDDPGNAEADVAQETTPASISDDQEEDNYYASKGSRVIVIHSPRHSKADMGMSCLLESRDLTDLVVICENVHFKVHKVVLAVQSEYFHRKLISSDGVKLSCLTLDVKPSMMEKCAEFMYTGKTEAGVLELDELKEVADQLGIYDLYMLCKGTELSNVEITTENCLELWDKGIRMKDDELVDNARTMSLQCFADLEQDREQRIAELSWECVFALLCDPNLNVSRVEERLTLALCWFRKDSDARIHFLPEMLRTLPLHKMMDWFLSHALKDPLLEDCSEAKEILGKAWQKEADIARGDESPESGNSSLGRALVVVGATDLSSGKHPDANVAVMVVPFQRDFPPKHLTCLPGTVTSCGGVACCFTASKLMVSALGDDQNQVWTFSLSSLTWHQSGELLDSRECHAMVVCEETVYVLGGKASRSRSPLVSSVEVFGAKSAVNSTWTPAGRLNGASCSMSTSACASGEDIIVYGIADEMKNSLLQVFSPSAGTVTSLVIIPDGFSSALGVAVAHDHVICFSATNTFLCRLSSLYNGMSSDVVSLPQYKTPNTSCAVALDEKTNTVYLVGGMPRVRFQTCFNYQTDVKNIVSSNDAGWFELAAEWPSSHCIIMGGSFCTADFTQVL